MGEETGNTIAEIMMKSKARGVQKAQLSSVPHLPAKTQVYDLGKHSSRECVCVCVCVHVGGLWGPASAHLLSPQCRCSSSLLQQKEECEV